MANVFSCSQFSGAGVLTHTMNTPPTLDASMPELVAAYIAEHGAEIKAAEKLVLPGQGHAAVTLIAQGELRWGLPKAAGMCTPGTDPVFVDLNDWGHNITRNYRPQRLQGELTGKYYVLVTGHPLSQLALQQLGERLPGGLPVQPVNFAENVDGQWVNPINTIDNKAIAGEGKNKIIDVILEKANAVGITVADWESGRVLLYHSGLGALTVLHTMVVYRLAGAWPNLVRCAAKERGAPFEVAEIIDLQAERQRGKEIKLVGAPLVVARDLANRVLADLPADAPSREELEKLLK